MKTQYNNKLKQQLVLLALDRCDDLSSEEALEGSIKSVYEAYKKCNSFLENLLSEDSLSDIEDFLFNQDSQ